MEMGSEAPSPTPDDAAAAEAMFAKRGCCCFWVPWPRDAWERIRPPAGSPVNTTVSTTASAITPVDRRDHDDHVAATAGGPTTRRWWWDRGVRALRKVREWSEVIAGPRWKTFLRRLGRRRRGGASAGAGGRFGYDPLSYARNFDERNGSGGNGGGADDSDDDAFRRGFSVRYAALPVSTKSSMDLGDLSDGGGEIVPWTRFTA
ncbi:uncharacterized protein LOC109718593 [Ananas comosus]|uniref:Uncharacterized protein LOC109718593 n=1 Tax=Ananas comosus TaxID=4615 RepID=A0A199W1J0_ANACO|nr:uncharacterized protein LOC109718593 [Ananas comosus]OAY83126.1 hypothetical protein ACMD2_21960 [Ananas comosus]